MRKWAVITAVIIIVALGAGCLQQTQAAGTAVSVGTQQGLTAEQFIQTMNVGWSLGNSFDSKGDKSKRGADAALGQERNWGNPTVTRELIDYVAASGFNTIRIPVTWYYNTGVDAQGNLVVGTQWLARIQEVVDYAIEDGLYVIINSHHDSAMFYTGVSEEEIGQVYADAASLWSQVAAYFKDYDEHLIFEAYNEVDNVAKSWNYSDTAAQQMNCMNQIFVNAVRSAGGYNADRILIVPTLLDGTSDSIRNAFVLPTDTVQDRLIVTVHSYTKKYAQDVEADFQVLEDFSEQLGVPVLIGEFGTTNGYPIAELRDEQASNFVARAAAHGLKCLWWDNGSDYAIINRKDLSKSNTTMIQALMAGTQGVAYEADSAVTLEQASQFEYKMPNLSTGKVETATWGTITSETITMQGVQQCSLSLSVSGDAEDIWLQRVVFYDASGHYISGKELQKTSTICDVPDGTAYLMVSLNSPSRNISWAEYSSYLTEGNLSVMVSAADADEVQMVLIQ